MFFVGKTNVALQNQQESDAARARSDLAAQYVRAPPRSAVSFVHTEQFFCPRKAIGNRSEISSPQAARLFAARFARLQKASRATRAQDDL